MKLHPLVAAGAALLIVAAPGLAHARHPHRATLGLFTRSVDIGPVPAAGSASYDAKTGVYRVTGGGRDIWAASDDFHFVAKSVTGDLDLAATLDWVTDSGDPHRKAGLMMRQSLAPDSPYVDVVVHGNHHVALQYREIPGGETHEIEAQLPGPGRFRLEREGDWVYMSVAGPDGVLHHAGGGFPFKVTGPYLAGLVVCAHDDKITKTVDFSAVTLDVPPPVPLDTSYNARVESTLETVDIATGYQAVIYRTDDHIEAPNWLGDGKTLLFNGAGSLFTLALDGGAPAMLDTGSLHKINNDHGVSADGRWLAISDQSDPDNQSRVYVLPLSGGQPRQVTAEGPSYWHGWAPDGRTLAVIARRNDDFDVYAIPSAGGAETRLTTTPGLDDGADYSPDGRWIYFNSVRSGNMKLWRMHPDGQAAEQLTFNDDSRDWFPHPSPDGKWIAFVSFAGDVAVGDHPPNHEVWIKVMPAAGGEARIVAHLFGGQGTMNVPSWSPDSTRLAFVSYRRIP